LESFIKQARGAAWAVVQKGFSEKLRNRQETWVPQREKRQQAVDSHSNMKMM